MNYPRLFPALPLLAALGAAVAPAAHATVFIDGGADSLIAPSLQAEFQVVYAGQQYTAAVVDGFSGTSGFLHNDCTFAILPDCSWLPPGAPPTVDFTAGLIPLTSTQIAAYNNGLGATNGPLIQFPLYGTPLTIPAKEKGMTQNGQLILDDGALCGIFSGQLTDWSQFSNSVPPGGFQIVYDQTQSSGSTYLLTLHLNAACTSTNSAFTSLPVPITSNFATLPVPGGVANNPRFVSANGSAGMQATLLSSGSAIGYLGPSYTSIAPSSTVTSPLVVAALVNSQNHVPYLPSIANTQLGLRSPGPGVQNITPPATKTQAANPIAWVPVNPEPGKGYPIVGYANWILSSCYSNVGPFILQYLTSPFQPTQHALIVTQNGFTSISAVNGKYYQAIRLDLLTNGNGFNLNIQNGLSCLPFAGR